MTDLHAPLLHIVTCTQFSFDQLAAIYNDTRIDYIVPMPMNGRRMKDYVRDYDVDLADSVVVREDGDRPIGMGMIAYRDDRAWLTRLGVSPAHRGRKVGLRIMQALLERAQKYGARQVQLEVIKGNEPAYRLFSKLGFQPVRELHVLSRPPAAVSAEIEVPYQIEPLDADAIAVCLAQRRPTWISWIEETPSLLNGGDLTGFALRDPSGSLNWIICRRTRFQLSHFTLEIVGEPVDAIVPALLGAVHRAYATQDAKYENIPVDSPYLPAFTAFGYIELFRRIEMTLRLG